MQRTGWRMAALAALTGVGLVGCDRPKPPVVEPSPTPTPVPSATPTPPPTPTPTPVIPRQNLEVSRLFNDIEVVSKVDPIPSDGTASLDRREPASYQLDLSLRVQIPTAAQTPEDFQRNDPKLLTALPGLPEILKNARVSPAFGKLYELKIENLRRNLGRLDALLSRHNFFDCETILELENPANGAIAVLAQGDMDVNTDGSDGDRNFEVDGSSMFFQPQTSYRWRKKSDRPNPFLARTQTRLADLKKEFATPGLTAARNRELTEGIKRAEATIYELKNLSFLISGNDPYIVLPGFMFRELEGTHAVAVGDYAVVVYDGILYPAIVGDAGPSFKFGEASVRLCKQVNPKSSAISRPISSLRATYIVFPGSAEKPFGVPDLARWHERCTALLAATGLSDSPLHSWEDLIQPWPTPTPSPTPVPATSEASPAPSSSDSSPTPAATETPESTPAPTP